MRNKWGGVQRKCMFWNKLDMATFSLDFSCQPCLLWRPALEGLLALFSSTIFTLQKRDIQKPDLSLIGYLPMYT